MTEVTPKSVFIFLLKFIIVELGFFQINYEKGISVVFYKFKNFTFYFSIL